ncbi:MAG TPA: fatty acid desaturase [Pirellulales bacterium]
MPSVATTVARPRTLPPTSTVPPASTLPAPQTIALARPTTAAGNHVVWTYVVGVGSYHALALLALSPWFFSWTGVALAFAGLYVFGTLGINLCFHRLLTHRSFECPKWLEHAFSVLGVCCLQDSPTRWVIAHRIHHQHSDDQPDPHSPLVNFLWGHMGWLFIENHATKSAGACDRYARDILRDPFYMRFERNFFWLWVNLIQAGLFYLAGCTIGWATTGSLAAATQFGASVLVWGVFVRTVAVWHITWSVNSLTHLWGYRTYETGENSRNNWLVALISNGEGWHNNHHADQRSAAHGHRWWEVDVTYLTICLLKAVGLAHNCIGPNQRLLDGASLGDTPADIAVD